MNVAALAFLLTSSIAVVTLRRQWAIVPLLASCCYMTLGQGVELGPVSLPVYRLVLAAGLLRAVFRKEGLIGGLTTLDKLVIAWGVWMVLASFFHKWQPGSGPVYALGFVYNVTLVYFLTRAWCHDLREMMAVVRAVSWLLVPVAVAMTAEHVFERNLFGVLFGGVSEGVYYRDGSIRAQGPFAHPILAGTVGAVCLPLMIGIWQRYRIDAVVGVLVCLAMVLTSSSSGPLMSTAMGVLALFMWFLRDRLRAIRWTLVGVYIVADISMNRPAYYLISEIDLTGSSTGWHRSRLIEAAFEHLSDWWAFGTDYTFNWMGVAVDEAGQHSDITNYYLWIGVIGGLPAMLLLIAVMWFAFVLTGKSVRNCHSEPGGHRFMIWCLGAGLFAHAGTSLSVAYFDQSMMFFWLNVGLIGSTFAALSATTTSEHGPALRREIDRVRARRAESPGFQGRKRRTDARPRIHQRT